MRSHNPVKSNDGMIRTSHQLIRRIKQADANQPIPIKYNVFPIFSLLLITIMVHNGLTPESYKTGWPVAVDRRLVGQLVTHWL